MAPCHAGAANGAKGCHHEQAGRPPGCHILQPSASFILSCGGVMVPTALSVFGGLWESTDPPR